MSVSILTQARIEAIAGVQTLPSAPQAQPVAQALDADNQGGISGSKPVARLSLEAVTALNGSCASCTDGSCSSCSDSSKGIGDSSLSDDEKAQIKELKKADQETRAHEQAHQAAGGPYAGAPSFEYEAGPDNKRYAVKGEVKIDSAPVPGNPQATIDKAEVVIRAALAPAKPSPQDYKVAAQARQTLVEAQSQLQAEKQDKLQGKDQSSDDPRAAQIQQQNDQISQIVSIAIA